MLKTAENCFLCKYQQWERVIWQNDQWYVAVDANPVSPGHLLIIPKRHAANIFGLTQTEFSDLQKVLDIAKSLTKDAAVKQCYEQILIENSSKVQLTWVKSALEDFGKEITGYNIGINDGASAGQTIFHLHIHLIPRYDGDVTDPTGGVRYVIPERGNYKML
jgi:diadenosine tetraphosphate (Ap4A) HIT family hydrolase